MTLPIAFDDVAAAARRLRGIAHRTPMMRSAAADERTGAQLFFKCENLQRVGAFKFRGAYNALARFDAAQRRAGAVAFSSGNHAQAVALSARLLGMPATIVMPGDAPAIKVAATRGYGAQVVLYDRRTEDREAIGRRLAQERGMTLVPPFDHPDVMAGQGTAALELIEDMIAALPEGSAKREASIWFRRSNDMHRRHPAVLTLAGLLGLTDEQVDDLFRSAAGV